MVCYCLASLKNLTPRMQHTHIHSLTHSHSIARVLLYHTCTLASPAFQSYMHTRTHAHNISVLALLLNTLFVVCHLLLQKNTRWAEMKEALQKQAETLVTEDPAAGNNNNSPTRKTNRFVSSTFAVCYLLSPLPHFATIRTTRIRFCFFDFFFFRKRTTSWLHARDRIFDGTMAASLPAMMATTTSATDLPRY